MPPAARKTDIGSGHECHFPPSFSVEGSKDVFINNLPAMRLDDAYAAHGCPKCPSAPHSRKLAQGSSTVNINHQPAGRIGDAINCGGMHATGSPDVMIGDDSYDGGEGPAKPKFRILLSQYPGDPTFAYQNEPYKLYVNGSLVKEGNTGSDGMVVYESDKPITGKVVVEAVFTKWEITMRAFSPADTDIGAIQRLHALGFGNHSDSIINPTQPEKISSEIGHFQTLKGEKSELSLSKKLKNLLKSQIP